MIYRAQHRKLRLSIMSSNKYLDELRCSEIQWVPKWQYIYWLLLLYITLHGKFVDIKCVIRSLRRRDNTMAKSKRATSQTMVHKALSRKLKIEKTRRISLKSEDELYYCASHESERSCICVLELKRVWRYQRGNHNLYIEEQQTKQ